LFTDGFKAYKNEDDVMKVLAEFSLANNIFAVLTEGYACKQSAWYVSIVSSVISL
jgi:F-type H+-transporting ATPase subunit gamma